MFVFVMDLTESPLPPVLHSEPTFLFPFVDLLVGLFVRKFSSYLRLRFEVTHRAALRR